MILWGRKKSRDKKAKRPVRARRAEDVNASLRQPVWRGVLPQTAGQDGVHLHSMLQFAPIFGEEKRQTWQRGASRVLWSKCHLLKNQFHDSFKRARLTSGQSCSVFGTTVCTAWKWLRLIWEQGSSAPHPTPPHPTPTTVSMSLRSKF